MRFYKHCCCCCCCCCNWRFPVRRWKWITEVPVVFNLPWIISTLSLRLQSSGDTEENGGKQNNFLSCVFHTFAYVTTRYQDFRFHTIQSFFCGINWNVIQLISDAKFSGPCLLYNKYIHCFIIYLLIYIDMGTNIAYNHKKLKQGY